MNAIIQIELLSDDGKKLTVPVSLTALVREHVERYSHTVAVRRWKLAGETIRIDLKNDDGSMLDSIRVGVTP